MAFDFKKEFKELYLPKLHPETVVVPRMTYIVIRRKFEEGKRLSNYCEASDLLNPVAFTIKRSRRGSHKIAGYFDFVVPPVEAAFSNETEGTDGGAGKIPGQTIYYGIRVPDFVTKEEFLWAVEETSKIKGKDFSEVEYWDFDEGMCVQCMHVGPVTEEDEIMQQMTDYMTARGFERDPNSRTGNHKIFLSDERHIDKEKLKTVLRFPIRNVMKGRQDIT